jgi:hypothetical protein
MKTGVVGHFLKLYYGQISAHKTVPFSGPLLPFRHNLGIHFKNGMDNCTTVQ